METSSVAVSIFLLEGTTVIFLMLLCRHMKQKCLLSLTLQVLRETLRAVIISYSGVEVFLAVEKPH